MKKTVRDELDSMATTDQRHDQSGTHALMESHELPARGGR